MELEDESLKGKLALHMALEHLSVGDASAVEAIEKAATRHVSAQLVALAAANAGFK